MDHGNGNFILICCSELSLWWKFVRSGSSVRRLPSRNRVHSHFTRHFCLLVLVHFIIDWLCVVPLRLLASNSSVGAWRFLGTCAYDRCRNTIGRYRAQPDNILTLLRSSIAHALTTLQHHGNRCNNVVLEYYGLFLWCTVCESRYRHLPYRFELQVSRALQASRAWVNGNWINRWGPYLVGYTWNSIHPCSCRLLFFFAFTLGSPLYSICLYCDLICFISVHMLLKFLIYIYLGVAAYFCLRFVYLL